MDIYYATTWGDFPSVVKCCHPPGHPYVLAANLGIEITETKIPVFKGEHCNCQESENPRKREEK
jgi:hypothetical protein